jgi:hypothetical protein
MCGCHALENISLCRKVRHNIVMRGSCLYFFKSQNRNKLNFVRKLQALIYGGNNRVAFGTNVLRAHYQEKLVCK